MNWICYDVKLFELKHRFDVLQEQKDSWSKIDMLIGGLAED